MLLVIVEPQTDDRMVVVRKKTETTRHSQKTGHEGLHFTFVTGLVFEMRELLHCGMNMRA